MYVILVSCMTNFIKSYKEIWQAGFIESYSRVLLNDLLDSNNNAVFK